MAAIRSGQPVERERPPRGSLLRSASPAGPTPATPPPAAGPSVAGTAVRSPTPACRRLNGREVLGRGGDVPGTAPGLGLGLPGGRSGKQHRRRDRENHGSLLHRFPRGWTCRPARNGMMVIGKTALFNRTRLEAGRLGHKSSRSIGPVRSLSRFHAVRGTGLPDRMLGARIAGARSFGAGDRSRGFRTSLPQGRRETCA